MSKEPNDSLEILTVNTNESLTDVDSPSPDSWMKKLAANKISNESDEEVEVKPRCSSPLFKTPLRKWRHCKRKTLKLDCLSSLSPHDNSDHIEGISILPPTQTSTPVQLIGRSLQERNDTQDRVVESLGTLFDEGNVSWTSSLATPRAANVTWNNLNTEEKKVLLPCQGSVNKSNGPQTPGSEDVLLQRVSEFSPLEELPEHRDASFDVVVCSQLKQVRKDGSHSPICSVKLKKRCKHKKNGKKQLQLSIKSAGESKKSEICLECPSVSKRLFTTKDNLEQYPQDSSAMSIKEDSSTQTGKEYVSETVATDDFHTPKLPKPQKIENTKNSESALTQTFFHDISFSTLEEVCQASEMMISAEVSPNNSERDSFMLDVSERCPGEGKENYVSVQQSSAPLSKSCASSVIRKKRIKFFNDSVNNSKQIGPGVKRQVEVDDLPKFDAKRPCSKQGEYSLIEVSADPVKFYNGSDGKVISRVKSIKSMKQTRCFYYSPVSEVRVFPRAEGSTLQLNDPPGLNNTESGDLESFCPLTGSTDCRSGNSNKNAVQDQSITSYNGPKDVISSDSHKLQEQRFCSFPNSGLAAKGLENYMKGRKGTGDTEKEHNSHLPTECHSSPKRDKKRLREEVYSADYNSVKTLCLSQSNSRHSSELVIINTKLMDIVNSPDVPYDISEHINNGKKSTSPEVISVMSACKYEEKEKVKQDFSNIVQDHNHSFTDTQMVHAVEDIEILLQLLEEEKNCQKSNSKLLPGVPDDSILGVNGTASQMKNIVEADQEKIICKKLIEFSSDKSPEIKGFSTAAGNMISVSEDALNKAKRLFENESDILTLKTLQHCNMSSNVKSVQEEAPSKNSDIKSVQEAAPSKNTPSIQEKVTDASTCFEFEGTTAVGGKIEDLKTEFCEEGKSLSKDIGTVNKVGRLSEEENQSGVNDRDLCVPIHVFKEIYQTNVGNETLSEAPVKRKTNPGSGHTVKSTHQIQQINENNLTLTKDELIDVRPLSVQDMKGDSMSEDFIKKKQNINHGNSDSAVALEVQDFITGNRKTVDQFDDSFEGEQNQFTNYSTQIRSGGVSTESCNSVCVSEKSFNKVQNMFTNNSSPVQPVDFPCANDKAVYESENSLEKRLNISAGDLIPTRPVEFSTASGKSGYVSEDSLKKPQRLFTEDSTPFKHSEDQGFSTAIAEAAQISEDSLKRVQELFAEDLAPIRLSEAQGFSAASGKAVQISEDSLKRAQKLLAEDSTPVQLSDSFSTASGKDVKISKDSLKKAQKLFSDDSTPIRPSGAQGFSTAISKAVQISENSMKRAEKLFAEDSTPIRPSGAQGFSTASGKAVEISENSLKRAQKLFTEDSTPVQPSVTWGFSTASGKVVKLSDDSLKKAQKLFSDDSASMRPPEAQIFSTASGKAAQISENSLKSSQKLFAEDSTLNSPSKVHGFLTASGKAVSISEDSIKRAKKLFAEDSTPIKPSKAQGFCTASGKAVQISEDSLKRVRKLFVEDSIPVRPSVTQGFSTVSGKAVQISEDSVKRAQKFSDVSTHIRPSEPQVFSTASGKAIQISEDSLKRAQKLFAEDSTLDSPSKVHVSSTASGQAVPISADSIERAEKLFAEDSTPIKPPKAQGFSTANGKAVQISENSLKKAQKLFAEDSTLVKPSNNGYSTARGKAVEISEDSMKRAQKLFTEDSTPVRPTAAQGFSTASGKAVHISEACLIRAQKLFSEDSTPVRPSVAQGFSTASGKAVLISEDSLKRAQKLFAEDSSPIRASDIQGFSTASGKAVQISEDSLKRAQKLFAEDSSPVRASDAQGFSTASGKAVQISEDSLKRAQKLFAEDSSPVRASDAQGFSSASGKAVQISEDSLKRAQKLFTKDSTPVRPPEAQGFSTTSGRAVHGSEDCTKRHRNIFAGDSSHITSSERRIFSAPNRKIVSSKDVPCKNLSQIAAISANDFDDDDDELSHLAPEDQTFSLLNDTEWNTSFSLVKTDCVNNNQVSKASKEFCTVPTLSQEVQECTSAILADELLVDENLDQVVTTPSWVTTFVTGPEMLYDRENAPQPVLASADNGRVPRSNSPVLGRSDRFKRGKRKSNCQMFFGDDSSLKEIVPVTSSSFKVPYKKMEAAKNPVRKKSSKQITSSLAFGTPFWRDKDGESSSKFDLPACSNVQEARQKAAQDQQKLINDRKSSSNWTRPCKGSLLLQKLKEREKQISWRQVTSGKPPTRYSVQQLLKYGLKENVIKVTAENAKDFKFCAWHYYSPKYSSENTTGLPVGDGAVLILDDKNQAGVEEVTRAFLSSPGVVPALVPPGWIHNHYRWLVWKLATTERSFPHLFANRCLTPNILMLQLKYRYDREIDLSQRPALRKILEKDDTPGKRIVLCVVRVIKLQSKDEKQEDERIHSRLAYELELTDGWYSVIAAVDQEMCSLIQSGKITVGTKIITYGAELVNCDEGCSPLEVSSNVRLKLHTNSTRRVRWDTKLGFFSHPGPLDVSLKSILPHGGLVSCTTVIIARVYPMLYVEKTTDGKSVIRSERAEAFEAARFEQHRQQRLESVYSQERKDMFKSSSSASRSLHRMSRAQVAKLTSGQELRELLDSAPDPASIEAMLNEDQRQILAEYQQNYQEQMMRELETRVRERLGEDSVSSRTVTSLLKVRCLDPKSPTHRSVMLSVWRAPEEILTLLKEGSIVKLFNVTCMGVRSGEKQLSGGRQTRYKPLPVVKFTLELVFPHRTVTDLKQAVAKDFNPSFGELDIVGVVVSIESEPQGNCNFNTVFVANAELVVLGISFWGGIKKFGWEDILKPETFIAASNLQWRQGAANRWIPCACATELSVFSQNPRQTHLRNAIDDLKERVHMDLKNFVSTCQNVILSLHANPESAAAQLHHERPSPVKLINNIHHTSPSAIEMRLYRLEQYEEPPPLPPLFLANNQAILTKEFHIPLVTSDNVEEEESPPLSLDSDPG